MLSSDFTLKKYEILIKNFVNNKYRSITFEKYFEEKNFFDKILILRHDVDKSPKNSLAIAIIEKKVGFISTYYFRSVKQSNNPDIIKKIAELGHEIGYHYEDLSLSNGNLEKAIESFRINLEHFRQFYPVKTICMHGSPLSKWDNRDLWKYYDYRDYGIIGEPYFDIDFKEVLYLTDTGRRWDGESVSVRDKISSNGWLSPKDQRLKKKEWNLKFRTTQDIIKAAEHCKLPDKIMITVHPQRWTNNPALWLRELIWQNTKNVIKKYYFVNRAKYSVR